MGVQVRGDGPEALQAQQGIRGPAERGRQHLSYGAPGHDSDRTSSWSSQGPDLVVLEHCDRRRGECVLLMSEDTWCRRLSSTPSKHCISSSLAYDGFFPRPLVGGSTRVLSFVLEENVIAERPSHFRTDHRIAYTKTQTHNDPLDAFDVYFVNVLVCLPTTLSSHSPLSAFLPSVSYHLLPDPPCSRT